ncbi:MAG: cell division protein FtsL [Pseudomonadota bacterium]
MGLTRQSWIVVAVLWCAVLGSAAGAVYTKHRSRELFVELERLHRQRDQLDMTWGLLQTEQSTYTAHALVETVAIQRLGMVVPDPARIQLVAP